MEEFVMHIPKAYNDGRAYESSAVMRDILETFGGYTCTSCTGGWIDPDTGAVYVEDMWRVVVGVDSSPDKVRAFRAIAHKVRVEAQQESVYVVMGGIVQFI